MSAEGDTNKRVDASQGERSLPGPPQVLRYDNLPPSRLLIPHQDACSSVAFYSESRRCRRKREYVDPANSFDFLKKFDEPRVKLSSQTSCYSFL